jgi:hypothetical protein
MFKVMFLKFFTTRQLQQLEAQSLRRIEKKIKFILTSIASVPPW